MRAIETAYGGYRFRSRIEARWAKFFTRLALDWEYEPQGFLVGDPPRPYLPDFLLPRNRLYLEIKPGFADRVDPEGVARWEAFAEEVDNQWPDLRTAMICGPIPDPERVGPYGPPSPDERWGHNAPVARYNDGIYVLGDWDYCWCACPGGKHFDVQYCGRGERITCDCEPRIRMDRLATGDHPAILNAYGAARAARFEHGSDE